ncbi:MAG: redoxin domain-containing protein [Saprospiraceae bacterium]
MALILFRRISFIPLLLMVLGFYQVRGTNIHNFTFTDTDNHSYNLYNDFLNQGKTVVIKFFFTTCPPCIAITPAWQDKYEEWGSGQYDVEFIEVSILVSDTNPKVKAFKNSYGLTMLGVGWDGNANAIIEPFQDGNYGSWWGTPAFAVISPSGELNYSVQFTNLDAAIQATGATKPSGVPDPTIYKFELNTYGLQIPDDHYRLNLESALNSDQKYPLFRDSTGSYRFSYPSSQYPELIAPIITFESLGPAYTNAVSGLDLVLITRHILGIEPFDADRKLKAADATADGRVNVTDLSTLRKVQLGILTSLPNSPSYIFEPETIELQTLSPGNEILLNFSIIKIGNVN